MRFAAGLGLLGALLALVGAPPFARGDEGKRAEQVEVLTKGIERLEAQFAALDQRVRALEGPGAAVPGAATPGASAPTFGAGGAQGPTAGLQEKHDRFTGQARVTAGSGWLAGRHKDTGAELGLALRYTVERAPGEGVSRALVFVARADQQAWPPDLVVYFLIDGKRRRERARVSAAQWGGTTGVLEARLFLGADLRELLEKPGRVEVRVGDVEVAWPPTFLQHMRDADRRCETLAR